MICRCIGIFVLLLASVRFTSARGDERHHLFQAAQNGKIGFIDSTGYFVIRPQFRSANDFSEGLAAVRIDGTYGFIDEAGHFVIEPQFDYATFFHEGLAEVFYDGKPFFIDRNGNKAFDNYFSHIGAFRNGRAKVSTGLHEGYINKTGALVIDTIYERIGQFVNGLALASNYRDHVHHGSAGIDSNGKLIVPFAAYDQIAVLSNGNFLGICTYKPGDLRYGWERYYTCIDHMGNVVFTINDSEHCWQMVDFSCGLAKVGLRTKSTTENPYAGERYVGFINTHGDVVLRKPGFTSATDFSCNRAFLWNKEEQYSLIDTKGTIIADKAYTGAGTFGANGMAFVRVKDKWGLIDTNGTFIISPRYDEIYSWADSDHFFFQKEVGKPNPYSRILLAGIASLDGTVLLPPIMELADRNGFQHGLVKCFIKNKPIYVNKKGEIVWREDSTQATELADLDIDFMNHGDYNVSVPADGRRASYDGTPYYGAQKIKRSAHIPAGQLSMSVRTTDHDTFRKVNNGIKVYVYNTTDKKMFFSADETLEMRVQAQDQHGNWRDIERVPHSGCGNSVHNIGLDAGEYWTFVTPVYKGSIKTQLRIALQYQSGATADDDFFNTGEWVTIYSNTYEGSINPAQFWRDHTGFDPYGLDPYPGAR